MPPRRANLLDVVLVIDRPSLPGGSRDDAPGRSGSSMADSGTLRQSSTDRLVALGCLAVQVRRRDRLYALKMAFIQGELAACGAN